jgi:DNA-binding response OmpR family regulator
MPEKPFALVIEDHEDHTIIFDNALSMVGFDTEVITDGAVAQRRLSEVVPALVVLDLHLPKVSGHMLLQQIRADERMAKTKVLVVTADESLAETLLQGADMVLVKPVSFSHLRAIVGDLLPEQ